LFYTPYLHVAYLPLTRFQAGVHRV